MAAIAASRTTSMPSPAKIARTASATSGVFSEREPRGLFDHGYSAAEAPESLRHLEADIAPAEYNQMRGINRV
jgi:hypothetical protein